MDFDASPACSEFFIGAIHDVTAASAASGNANHETVSPTFSASVLHTSPASTFPLAMSLRTSLPVLSMSCGCSRTPVRSSSCWVADVQAPGSPHTATRTPGRVRSANEATWSRLPGAVAMTRLFAANGTGAASTRPAFATADMLSWSPDTKTSTSAPSNNCAESSDELAKMNSTDVPGFSASNCLPIAVRLVIIDDDANTVIDVVAGCGCESHPLAETTNRIPTAIVRFNRSRIAVDDTDSYSAN